MQHNTGKLSCFFNFHVKLRVSRVPEREAAGFLWIQKIWHFPKNRWLALGFGPLWKQCFCLCVSVCVGLYSIRDMIRLTVQLDTRVLLGSVEYHSPGWQDISGDGSFAHSNSRPAHTYSCFYLHHSQTLPARSPRNNVKQSSISSDKDSWGKSDAVFKFILNNSKN